jgi:hypothetical protein
MVSADESSFNSMSVHHIFLINLPLRPCLHKEKKVLCDLRVIYFSFLILG